MNSSDSTWVGEQKDWERGTLVREIENSEHELPSGKSVGKGVYNNILKKRGQDTPRCRCYHDSNQDQGGVLCPVCFSTHPNPHLLGSCWWICNIWWKHFFWTIFLSASTINCSSPWKEESTVWGVTCSTIRHVWNQGLSTALPPSLPYCGQQPLPLVSTLFHTSQF